MARRRRLWPRILGGLLVLLVLAAVGGYWYARPLLLTGTGYAAHSACASMVAGHRDPGQDLPPNPLVPYLRTEVTEPSTTSSVMGVLAKQTAWTTPYGCVVADARPGFRAPQDISDLPSLFHEVPSPTPDEATRRAVARAFGDDLMAGDKAVLGTRAVVALRGGRLVAERYADGFTANTPQLGWSMSKSVASLLTGRLVKEGKVSLAADHLRPEWTDERARITVEDLLRMRSGLTWDETYDIGTTITRMLYLEPDMGRYAASQPLAHPVGTYQQYSSGSTNVLCSVLRAKTGRGPELGRAELFEPLGIAHVMWEPDASGTPVCSSYLWATPRDWAALGQFALQDGQWQGQRLLPDGWMRQTTTAVDRSGEEKGYAAGWWTNRQPDGKLVDDALPADAYWMSGHDGQRVVVVPSAQLVVVRLGFTPTDVDLRVNALVAELAKAR